MYNLFENEDTVFQGLPKSKFLGADEIDGWLKIFISFLSKMS